ncbi:MAG: hypothetical protein QM730_26625 [Anaerolineales bacterium]
MKGDSIVWLGNTLVNHQKVTNYTVLQALFVKIGHWEWLVDGMARFDKRQFLSVSTMHDKGLLIRNTMDFIQA